MVFDVNVDALDESDKFYHDLNLLSFSLIEKLKVEYYETKFNIETVSYEKDKHYDRFIYNNYEPTDYSFLEYLFKKHPFGENDHLVDFGCGKGRVLIVAAEYSCPIITGIESNNERFILLNENINNYKQHTCNDAIFYLKNDDAIRTVIDDTMNKFYFFNPFHLKIYIKILNSILNSIVTCWRKIQIMVYRPDISIIKYIEDIKELKLIEQVDIKEGHSLYKIYSNIG